MTTMYQISDDITITSSIRHQNPDVIYLTNELSGLFVIQLKTTLLSVDSLDIISPSERLKVLGLDPSKAIVSKSNLLDIQFNQLFLPQTSFQKKVLLNLLKLSSPVSYGEFALQFFGSKSYARAVGSALASNPIPVILPCHRVINADRSIGAFRLGTHWKQKLLDLDFQSPSY